MIKGIFIVNNHGKPRLVKCYDAVVSSAGSPHPLGGLA